MNKVIVYAAQDGTCHVVVPAPEMFNENSKTRQILAEKGLLIGASEEDVLNWIKAKDAPANAIVVDKTELPEERDFRNAWVVGRQKVLIDMEKAQEIHKNTLRELRKPKLELLDVTYLRALETGNVAEQEKIKKQKQELRDVTALDMPSDPKALKNFIPDILK